MSQQATRAASRTFFLGRILRTIASIIFLTTLTAHAQLPAGTTDTSAQPTQAPQDPALAQATEALDKQEYPTALRLLTALTEKSPTDAHILYDLAFTQDALAESSGHPAEAEATYRRAIAASPSFLDPHVALGLLLARNGKITEARTELLTATTLPPTPSEPDNPLLKARAFRALARLDRPANPAAASDDLLQALKLSPETPDDILLTGELAEASSDPSSAEAAYRRLLTADPNNSDATAALTHLLLTQKKTGDAEALLTSALAKDPDNPTLNAQLASLYDQQGKTAQAVPLLEKLHAAHPADENLTRLLARLYARNQQYDQAEPLYTALSASAPQDVTLADDLADTQIHLKKFAQAETLLKRAVAQPSAFPSQEYLAQVASHLAFAASENHDPATTLQGIEIRDRVLPQSPSSLFLAATAHDRLHHTKQAADLYKQFLSVANGKFPDEEWEARHRLVTLEHMK